MSKQATAGGFPPERDFTAGMTTGGKSFVGSTGEGELDARIAELARGIAGVREPEALAEMLITAVRMARGRVSPADFKLFNRALKELRRAAEVFERWTASRKVAIFGSARTESDAPQYKAAAEFAGRMRDAGFMTITGAGPGIMAAGNEGAGRDDSFGLNIVLPFEAVANEFIAGDEKLVEFNYFFTRKLWFVKESDALVAFPGGFGTMDEVFETLTLIQTGKSQIMPVVLLDIPGGTYWRFWDLFVRDHLLRGGLISADDLALYRITDNLDEAVAEITNFYKVFHSYRYVGDQLVIRLLGRLPDATVARLQADFADIIKAGGMRQCGPLRQEGDEPELAGLTRLVFRHRRSDFGRLRRLIDAINQA
jgi:hypothetical protein